MCCLSISSRKEGIATFELIISLALIAPLLLILTRSSILCIWNTHTLNQERELQIEYADIKSLLEKAGRNLDSFRFKVPIRTHKNGFISLINGKPNKIMQSNFLPKPGSDALSSMALDIEKSLRAHSVEQSANEILVEGCFRNQTLSFDQPFQSFIGVSLDSLYELKKTGEFKLLKKGCYRTSFAAVNSMLLPNSPDNYLKNIRLLIPIKELSTIYLDKFGALRLMRHLGEENIENAPLSVPNKEAALSLNLSTNSGIQILSVVLRLNQTRKFQFNFHNHLARLEALNFVANL